MTVTCNIYRVNDTIIGIEHPKVVHNLHYVEYNMLEVYNANVSWSEDVMSSSVISSTLAPSLDVQLTHLVAKCYQLDRQRKIL